MPFRKVLQNTALAFCAIPVFSMVWGSRPSQFSFSGDVKNIADIPLLVFPADTDTTLLPYPFHDRLTDRYSNDYDNSPLYLDDPQSIKSTIEYDPDEKQYNINENIGDMFYRNPSYLTFDEFKRKEFDNSTRKYWRQRAGEEDILLRKGFNPKIYVGSDVFDRIFGGNTIDIRPQGSAELKFGFQIQTNDNPAIPEKQRTSSTFVFEEQIQMSVIGNIGEKMKLQVNYNTEASFDFENKMKLEYTGKEDEIIQKIEAGNVSLPLTTSLITGSQSLFGLKTQLKFGRMTVTSVFSQQKGQRSTIDVPPGGGQITNFEILCDEYEANKHFFLSQYFKDNYDNALKTLPVITSPFNITRIEVWKTNRNAINQANRDIVAFMDLGEYDYFATNFIGQGTSVYPSDSLSNDLYIKMTKQAPYNGIRDVNNAASILGGLNASPTNFAAQQDYVILKNARKLEDTDYTLNARLGYISLNSALNPDEVIAVAYEYTIGNNVFRVGELTTTGIDPTQALVVKLIRSKAVSPKLPTWDLMMKNIYSLQGYQISRDNFKLNVYYADDNDGGKRKRFIPGILPPDENLSSSPIITMMNLDKLNTNGDPVREGDGVFDFVEGTTINTQTGRIIFPVREPFGSYLRGLFKSPANADKYVYEELYDSTITVAQQFAQKNKFSLEGSYQSASGSEISLNAINIPQGSVVVTQGGAILVENTDYTVDYNLGKVKIINAGRLASNIPIQVSVESQSLFSIQSKTLFGARFDYEISKDLTVGGTYLHLNERPITQKVNIGDEPISNTIWGLDGTYRTDSRVLTKLIDKIPFIDTKEKSTVTFSGEFAQFIPGHSEAIGSQGNAYIDDFEGSQSTIDLKNPFNWYLASTPQGQPGAFPETQGSFVDSLRYGFNRAKLTWHYIDASVFYRNNDLLPPGITDDDLSNNNVRAINEKEIFPNKENPNNVAVELQVMNMEYYPEERGPYNFDVDTIPGISFGIDNNGKLRNPGSRWGGIMRRVESSDFEAANVEFIQFWVMDPFHEESINTTEHGKLIFNLGNISEDILSDGQQFFENGMPSPTNNFTVDFTSWGRTPKTDYLIDAFDNDDASRDSQDVGLDGLSTVLEQSFFQPSYLDRIVNSPGLGQGSPAYQQAIGDPSADDYHYFRGSDLDNPPTSILDRYKRYNNTEGNSNTSQPEGYTISNTTTPDKEDINKDFQTESDENYNEYEVTFPCHCPDQYPYLIDSIYVPSPNAPNNNAKPVTWYQFKIPIAKPDRIIGLGANMKSVNFVRMYFKDWDAPVVMRFAKLELLRGEWRRYPYDLVNDQVGVTVNNDNFDVTVVNLEENGKREPIKYVLPPGIERQVAVGTTNQQQLNEQSLSLRACQLQDGESRGTYKNTQFDVRNYKTIKMFIHAEDANTTDELQDRQIVAYVRMGTDFSANYYEYEIPLKITRHTATTDAEIWPSENELVISIQNMINAKVERDKQGVPISTRFAVADNNNRIIVKGTPSLSNVKSILIGLRNYPQGQNPFSEADDGLPKCVEVWVNELRMTDFNEEGGWAANARVQAKLADFGQLTVSGARSTYGFGQLESKINERQQDNRVQYDLATSLELGKFFPQKTGISVPMYIGYSKEVARPEYNPLNPDVKLDDALSAAPTPAVRDSLIKIAEDMTRRKSINFTNVRKNKTGNATKSHVYDVENFNLTYGYSETFRRNVNTEYDIQKDYLGAIGYNYNTSPKGISPFSKMKSKSKYVRPIKDFNFNFVPSSFSFRGDINRHYQEVKLRNINNDAYAPPPTFDKRFLLNRQYSLSWDLAKSIKLDFDANNTSRVDEPEGKLDTQEKRDTMWGNFWNGGRNTEYRQSGNLSYNVPLNKLPITDWISMNARYGFEYHWLASSLIYDPITNEPRINPALGNTIENSNNKQLNSTFTFTTLYNKVPFFKKLLSPPKPKPKTPPKPKVEPPAPKDTTGGKKTPVPKVKKEREYGPLVRGIAKVIFSIKNFSLNLTENEGTLLPGFTRSPEILGNNFNYDGSGVTAPGFGFSFGQQDPNFKNRAAENQWITRDSTLNNQFLTTYTRNLTARSSIEPLDGFKIELNASRSYSKNHSEYFRANAAEEFNSYSSIDQGNFSISWLMINTAFNKDNKDYSSDIFKKFSENRIIISRRLAELNALSSGLDSAGYNDGYGGSAQEVLTYAFLSAYSGKDASTMKINLFQKTPLPNWRINYDGLSKLAFTKKLFQSISLTHGYRSTYNINSYSTSLLRKPDGSARDQVGNFIPEFELQQITLSEQFTPLIGVDITWKNKLSTRFEYKKDRNLSLTYAGVQLTEIKGTEFTFGAGYRFKPKWRLKLGGKKITLNNELNLTADVSYRKNSTILRKLLENIDQPTAGLNVFSFKTAADYAINERFNVRAYFEREGSTPLISTSFPTTRTEFGFTIRFILAQ